MPALRFQGPVRVWMSSFLALNRIAVGTYLRRLVGRRMVAGWDAELEIGVRFWRHQFTRALHAPDMALGRVILDSLQTDTPDVYDVETRAAAAPNGVWYTPKRRLGRAVVLYFHGGGYAFHGAMSRRFAAMLAHHIAAPVFAPDYRLTPEHPHPAQAEDALAAWRFVRREAAPEEIVVIGDSAGGHMALRLLTDLRDAGEVQPALCIGLCPWTDVGDRGASLHENDASDLVQGWMALQFGTWLDPEGRFGRNALSPIAQDYNGLAPLYLQSGGREILHDMIRDFARVQAERGAEVMLECWPEMPHDFQLFDSTQADAGEALTRIVAAVRHAIDAGPALKPGAMTVVQGATN